MIFLRLLTLVVAVVCAPQIAAADGKIPIENFFRDAEMSQPRLSRDGTRVVFLVRNPPARNSIAVWNVASKTGGIVFIPNDYNVDFAFWKGDRIVFGGDAGGNESYALRSIKADGSSLRDLSESTGKFRGTTGPVGGNVFSTLPDDPDHILVAGFGTRRSLTGGLQNSGEYGLYRLHVGSGRRISVETWHDRATSYFVDDRSGRVFGRELENGRERIIEIKPPSGDYRRVAHFTGSTTPWAFIGLLPGERDVLLQVRSPDEHDRGALYVFNRETMKRGKLLYSPPEGEIAGISRGPDGRIVSITYEGTKAVTEWFDAVRAKHHASLKATFAGKQVDMVDSTDDARWHIVKVHSDRDPGAYYLFDSATPVITPIGRVNPSIDPEQMAERQPISFASRDGLEIRGYLTRPRMAPDAKTPLIILPHGGPFGIRDSWWFDAEAQFLASRGYAVLQVNYRGSGGYGARFEAAGKRQWGRAMQDDLTDAVQWAIDQGITSPDRVGICGASYGGYAALAGLTFTPELYRCAVNYVGVSDLRILLRPNQPTHAAYDAWAQEWIGANMDDLRARSPVAHVANIKAPSLHAYGENDPRVDIAHWKLLERELVKHNKPYERIREGDEGHGFEDEKRRVRFYAAVETFLAKHLPAHVAVSLGESKTIELPAK